jgi:type IV secretion system protein VirD4
MSAQKRRLFLLLPPLLGAMLGLWGATQLLAHKGQYAASLGPPLWAAGDFVLYAPWKSLEWWLKWHTQNPSLFSVVLDALLVGLGVGMLLAFALHRILPPPPQKSDVHGSSRWADTKEDLDELRRPAPLSVNAAKNDGVIIGKLLNGDYLVDNEPTHVLVYAPTRSGKGVGIVIPTLLNWQRSTIVLDIKGENWQTTAGWRDQFSHTLRFNPRDPESARYNPLLEIRPEADVADAQALAATLCDPDAKGDLDHWRLSARELLVGVTLHVLYAEEDKSLGGVVQYLSDPRWEGPKHMYEHMSAAHHLEDGSTHPRVAEIARTFISKPDKERASIESTAISFLQLWRDPVVAANTSTSDFRARDLMNADAPVSLYLDVPPADLTRVKPLLRLMVIQFCQRLSEDFGNAKHDLLWMLDEFPVLGKMDFWESALAYIAGAGMKAVMICQDLKQLDKHYGDNNAIMANSHTKVTFAPNDEKTARRISELLGKTTVDEKRVSFSSDYQAMVKSSQNESYNHVGRPLLTPGEIMQLPFEEELILRAGKRPVRARKVLYFQEEHFQRRADMEPPASTVPPGTFADSSPNPWTHEPPGVADIDFFEDFTPGAIYSNRSPLIHSVKKNKDAS